MTEIENKRPAGKRFHYPLNTRLQRLAAPANQVLPERIGLAVEHQPEHFQGVDVRVVACRKRVELNGGFHRRQVLGEDGLAGKVQLQDRGEAAVRGDAEEFGVVFGNLLDNAIKYSPQRVQIEVAVEEGAGRVIVEIADRGIGIPRGELRKVFQRFYRAGLDVQRKAAGLGLGLFIVRSLVLRHGGRVVARSEGIGKGSRFAVTLPAAAPAEATEAAPLHVAHPGR